VERLRLLCSPQLIERIQLREPSDLSRATLIHSSNALTWTDYLRNVVGSSIKARHELWFDRSTMDAAVDGLGVILESEILAAEELETGTLVVPFDDPKFEVVLSRSFSGGKEPTPCPRVRNLVAHEDNSGESADDSRDRRGGWNHCRKMLRFVTSDNQPIRFAERLGTLSAEGSRGGLPVRYASKAWLT
jgi:hypothetical protein